MIAKNNQIVFCQIAAPYDMEKALENVKLVQPFIENSIVCCSEISHEEEFKKLGTILIKSDTNDDFPSHRNLYLEKAKELNFDYVLTCDADERFNPLFLSSINFILSNTPQFNGYEIKCNYNIDGIEKLDPDEVFRECPGGTGNKTNWWKLVLFKLEPSMKYIGYGPSDKKVHESLYRPLWKVLKLPQKYFMDQNKTAEEIWRNSARNVLISGGGNNVGDANPLHKKLKKYYNSWLKFYNDAIANKVPDEVKEFIIEHRNDVGYDYCSENRGAFKWFKHLDLIYGYESEYKEGEYEGSIENYVKSCYFKVLNRHPDHYGLNHYSQLIRQGNISFKDLPNILMNSDEFMTNMINTTFYDLTYKTLPLFDVKFVMDTFKGEPQQAYNYLKKLANFSASTKVVYCQMTHKGDLEKTIENVKSVKPYVDACIVVYDQSLSSEDIENLVNSGCIATYYKWEENFPKQRNNYIAEALSVGAKWILVSDPDEHFDETFLKALRFICGQSEANFIDLLLINSHDVFTDDENGKPLEKPNELVSDYYKNLLFRATPTIFYVGIGETQNLHEQLIGATRTIKLPKDFFYRHIKSHVEIWEHATRNVFISGGGMNMGSKVPHYATFKNIVNRLGIKTWQEFRSYLLKGNIDQELKDFIIAHRNDFGHDYDSEYREMFKWYFYILHPEENVNNLVVDVNEKAPIYEGIEAIINETYNKILKRNVDPEGLKHYKQMLESKQISVSDLENILRNSDEYRGML